MSFPNFPNVQNLIWDNKLKRNKSKERSQELKTGKEKELERRENLEEE